MSTKCSNLLRIGTITMNNLRVPGAGGAFFFCTAASAASSSPGGTATSTLLVFAALLVAAVLVGAVKLWRRRMKAESEAVDLARRRALHRHTERLATQIAEPDF